MFIMRYLVSSINLFQNNMDGKMTHQDIGQMDMYMHKTIFYLQQQEKKASE